MSSRFLSCGTLLLALLIPAAAKERVLRVCADPDNMPFSNKAQQGFENRIADLMARDLQARLEYVWWPERKAFIKNSLNEHQCDVLLGVPTATESALTTTPYYRSTYVFLARRDRGLHLASLNDPRLANMRIGAHLVGNGYVPPAFLLANRGLVNNLVGYKLSSSPNEPDQPAKLVEAVAHGDVDAAIIWGPFGGYYAKRQPAALEINAVTPSAFANIPFTYDISLGVRKEDDALKQELDLALRRNCAAIQSLLAEYGVPVVSEGQLSCAEQRQSASVSLP